MHLVARMLRYLTNRYLAEPRLSNQSTARANAAQATATLRKRRHERESVDAYVQAKLGGDA